MPCCRSTLRTIERDGYAPAAARRLSGGKRSLPHRLDITHDQIITRRAEDAEHLSISGIQDKLSLRFERGKLLPATSDGEFILKPIPSIPSLAFREDVPANEHVTMQIASQVFGIATPPCALVELKDGEPAYLVRRFDRAADGTKIPQEDFCQLSNRSEETHGRNYKYDATMEETGVLLRRFCSAARVELEKLYLRHLFNYAVSNGDAHLKNFSLHQSPMRDYLLTPAYDLLCTSLHMPNEARCALDLFTDDDTAFFQNNGFPGREDFLLLAGKFGMNSDFAGTLIDRFSEKLDEVRQLVERSFLSAEACKDYLRRYEDRLNALAP